MEDLKDLHRNKHPIVETSQLNIEELELSNRKGSLVCNYDEKEAETALSLIKQYI